MQPQQYYAFLSYRHADNRQRDREWASWLHYQLETYEVPADLIGTRNERGELIPEKIYPIFRDETSLPADANLANSVTEALNRSLCLVVLCSPRAVESNYVAEEILHFKRIGREERIMAALLAGEPNASVDSAKRAGGLKAGSECFPLPLQHPLDDDGNPDPGRRLEPIAADFRLPDGSEGFTSPEVWGKQLLAREDLNRKQIAELVADYRSRLQRAKLKIVAGILGIPLEALWKRDQEYALERSKRRTKILRRITLAMGCLTLIALSSLALAVVKKRDAEQARDRADQERQRAQSEEAKAWLERSNSYADEPGMGFFARLMALRPLGYSGHEPVQTESGQLNYSSGSATGTRSAVARGVATTPQVYLPLLENNHDLRARAEQLLNQFKADPIPIWRSPGKGTGEIIEPSAPHSNFGSYGKLLDYGHLTLDLTTGKFSKQQGHTTEVADNKSNTAERKQPNEVVIMLQEWEEGPRRQVEKPLGWAYSPDGNQLVVGFGDRTVRSRSGDIILEPEAIGEPFESLGGIRRMPGEGVTRNEVAFSPDGKTIASGRMTGAIVLIDAADNTVRSILPKNHYPVTSLAFRPDSRLLASGHTNGEVQIWDIENPGAPPWRFASCSPSTVSTSFGPDGKTILVDGSDGISAIWSLAGLVQPTRREIAQYLGGIVNLSISSNSRFLFGEDIDGNSWYDRVWDLAGELSLGFAYRIDERLRFANGISPTKFAASLEEYYRSGNSYAGDGPAGFILPQGRGADADGVDLDGVNLIDAKSENVLRTIEDSQWAYFNHDQSLMMTTHDDGTIAIWDGPLGQRTHTVDTGSDAAPECVAVSRDGRLLAFAIGSGTIHLWDLANNRRTETTLKCQGLGEIAAITFTPTGDRLFAGGEDGVIHAWDLSPTPETISDYLTGGWVTLQGKNVRWVGSMTDSRALHHYPFLNVPPRSHLGILRSGLPQNEIDRALFWIYFRARNWDATIATYHVLSTAELQTEAMRSLVQWLSNDMDDGEISVDLAAHRAYELRTILASEPEEPRMLGARLLDPDHSIVASAGATYQTIADGLGITDIELRRLNESTEIKDGLTVKIPPFRAVRVSGEFDSATFAKDHGTTVEKLAKLNGWEQHDYQQPSIVLVPVHNPSQMPDVKKATSLYYRVMAGDSYEKIARSFGAEEEELRAANGNVVLVIGSMIQIPPRPQR